MEFMTLLILLIINGAEGIVFLQDTISITIPADFPASIPFYEVRVIGDVTGSATEDVVFQIFRTTIFYDSDSVITRKIFKVNPATGALYISEGDESTLRESIGVTFTVEIAASDKRSPLTKGTTVIVSVTNSSDPCRPREDLCFLSPEIIYVLPESLPKGILVGTVRPYAYKHLCPYIKPRYALISNGPLSVKPSSGDIILVKDLDFETIPRHHVNLSCTLTTEDDGIFLSEFSMDLTIRVKDVDDHAPYLQNSTNATKELDTFAIVPGEPLPLHFIVIDRDSLEVNNISVLLDDPLNLFFVQRVYPYANLNISGETTTLLHAAVVPRKPFRFPGRTYNFSVLFEDKGLITNENNKVRFDVLIHNKTLAPFQKPSVPQEMELKTSLSSSAAKHARVAHPIVVNYYDGLTFDLAANRKARQIFGVTPRTGIVYLKNEVILTNSKHNSFHLNLTWRANDSTSGHCIVVVEIIEPDESSSRNKCVGVHGYSFPRCARHHNDTACNASCGRGSSTGFCKWRGHPSDTTFSRLYATCVPDGNTCPDGFCDELEDLDPNICPQDCAQTLQGEASQFSSKRGIHMAVGPCMCDGVDTCVCSRNYPPSNQTKKRLESRNRLGGSSDLSSNGLKVILKPTSEILPWTKDTDNGFIVTGVSGASECGYGCVAVIVLAVFCTLVLVASLLLYHHMKKSRLDKHKYVGNRVPLTAVGSDYVDDRTVTGVDSHMDSTIDKSVLDPKWEFPRDRLILEETLGEGEFGKVMRAQAWSIADRPGYSTVAVKMLKNNGTCVEEQDLISEFNLLKEVSHPNVIQLLGACTLKGGPLYVIVEFAEHGSLRGYLRKKRRNDFHCGNVTIRSVVNPSYFSPEGITRQRQGVRGELFSFAWQISKGMAYLSDMKLVHRDLATRNVLLAAGKVAKISDFGLSRDVYEGDTYLKTTKGRVPVKWMAIESLQDHVYTSKSDVWSYGIVLWEIITLGAAPYPGIIPERLYHLLKGGYRMPQPDGCPDELYQIMRMCWRAVPQERPCFKELVQRMDQLLQDTVEYLPLGPGDFDGLQGEDLTPTPLQSPSDDTPIEEMKTAMITNASCKLPTMHKPNFHFSKIPESNYENSRLLPTSPEDSSGCDATT